MSYNSSHSKPKSLNESNEKYSPLTVWWGGVGDYIHNHRMVSEFRIQKLKAHSYTPLNGDFKTWLVPQIHVFSSKALQTCGLTICSFLQTECNLNNIRPPLTNTCLQETATAMPDKISISSGTYGIKKCQFPIWISIHLLDSEIATLYSYKWS